MQFFPFIPTTEPPLYSNIPDIRIIYIFYLFIHKSLVDKYRLSKSKYLTSSFLSYFNTLAIFFDFWSIGGNLINSSPSSNKINVGNYLDIDDVFI